MVINDTVCLSLLSRTASQHPRSACMVLALISPSAVPPSAYNTIAEAYTRSIHSISQQGHSEFLLWFNNVFCTQTYERTRAVFPPHVNIGDSLLARLLRPFQAGNLLVNGARVANNDWKYPANTNCQTGAFTCQSPCENSIPSLTRTSWSDRSCMPLDENPFFLLG